MSIDFDAQRWDALRATYAAWWDGRLDRPLIPVVAPGRDPGRPCPAAPLLSQQSCADFSWSPEDLVDRLDYELASYHYLGDAFPWVNMDCFGPGVLAAMLGAELDNSTGQVWFWPPAELPIQEIHLAFDPQNRWFRRILDICAAAMERWQGRVLMGMTDLGGNLDVPATFRGTQNLLMDLIDAPEEVERLAWEAHHCWHQAYAAINDVLQPTNPGYSDWSGLYSDRPAYILQSDFSYMISPQMFSRFVLPELQASCRRLPRTVYHLDGVGQIPHLEQVLSIAELDGVQWVPGDGKPNCAHWPEIYQAIHAAGKRIQLITGEFDAVDAVAAQIGAAGVIQHRQFVVAPDQADGARARLAAWGIGG